MSNNQSISQSYENTNNFSQILGRFITAAIVLGVTAFFTPGFTINNIWTLIIATLILTIMDYLISKFTGLKASPFGKGIVGFILAVITLYLTQYFVAGYSISWIAAIIGSLIYGMVDYFLPGDTQM